MPRIARIVIPHYPHHVTQRDNRRQRVFLMTRVFVESGENIVHQGSTFNIELFIK